MTTEAGKRLLGGIWHEFSADPEDMIAAIEAEAIAAERARIAAAVRDMRWAPDSDEDEETEWVDRAAVLALLEPG
jgi:hypothetical protein